MGKRASALLAAALSAAGAGGTRAPVHRARLEKTDRPEVPFWELVKRTLDSCRPVVSFSVTICALVLAALCFPPRHFADSRSTSRLFDYRLCRTMNCRGDDNSMLFTRLLYQPVMLRKNRNNVSSSLCVNLYLKSSKIISILMKRCGVF